MKKRIRIEEILDNEKFHVLINADHTEEFYSLSEYLTKNLKYEFQELSGYKKYNQIFIDVREKNYSIVDQHFRDLERGYSIYNIDEIDCNQYFENTIKLLDNLIEKYGNK